VVQSAEQASKDRYSLAFFADPDVGSVVDVPPELLVGKGKKKLYEPTTSDAYLLEKLRAMGRGENPVDTGNEEKKE
jgi:isopenicillin N synthase-like dioxygenase